MKKFSPNVIAMIPARMGSQRLAKKNLKEINGTSLIELAILKCTDSNVFSEVWVNSEDREFEDIANRKGVHFHHRPAELAGDNATSEDFIYEFLKNHDCDYLVQVHSIAPLLNVKEIKRFVNEMVGSRENIFLSYEAIQIEVSFDSEPINFTYREKINSQELKPIQRISWAITAWKSKDYITNYETGKCATYSGNIKYIEIGKLASHVIKVQEDLEIARLLYNFVNE